MIFHKPPLSFRCFFRAFPLQRGRNKTQLTDYYFWELDQFSAELPYICETHQINIGCIQVKSCGEIQALLSCEQAAISLSTAAKVESPRAPEPTTLVRPAGRRRGPSARSGTPPRSGSGSPRSSWTSWGRWRGTTSAGTRTENHNLGVLSGRVLGTMTFVTFQSAMLR